MDIKKYIQSSGLSRAEICRQAGISRPFLSLIENGERQIGIRKVKALARVLGVTINDLRPDLVGILT